MALRVLAIFGIVIFAGFAISAGYGEEFGLLQDFQPFEDEYPDGQEWGGFGTHDNTTTNEDGELTLEDGEDTGTFQSNVFQESDGTIVNLVEVDGRQLSYVGSNQRKAYLVMEGYMDGEVVEEHEFQVSNEPKIIDEDLFSEQVEAYSYRFELEVTGGSTLPKVTYLEVDGTRSFYLLGQDLSSITVSLFMALLVGMGLLYVGKAVGRS